MARTVDPVAHASRRDAYVDAAFRIIQTKGYEGLSIADVIADVGTSKGAFFHYFDSKAALLAAVVDRMVESAIGVVTEIAGDPGLRAIERLEGVFTGIAQWKRRQPEFQPAAIEDLMRTWYADENALVVERLRGAVAERLVPMLAAILRDGARDGSFAMTSPEGSASVVASLLLGLNDVGVRLFLARRDGSVSFETVMCTFAAYSEAIERVLGIPPASWPLVDESTIRFWFG
jgi:AcrR family transcriptional regulator